MPTSCNLTDRLRLLLHFQIWGTDSSELGQYRENETTCRYIDRRGHLGFLLVGRERNHWKGSFTKS